MYTDIKKPVWGKNTEIMNMVNIIPVPKKNERKNGTFSLENVGVFVPCDIDVRVKKAASALAGEISKKIGAHVKFSSGKPEGKYIYITGHGEGESYVLDIGTEHAVIEGSGAAGAFYGIQSLRQLIFENGTELPCCTVEDAPDFGYRGFYQDITRGRVNSLEKLKKIADMLSYYKINSLQLYVEDSFLFKEFEGIITKDDALCADEILELDEYCNDRFIELIPSLSTFGHLFTLLQSEKYSGICELGEHKLTTNYWMERQWHHTVDVYNPETIKIIGSMIEQYITLFRSDKFNICCDETMDLCNGKNKGRDKGEAYFYHVNQLIEIVKSHGKKVMLWGDECMSRAELAKKNLPEDVIILNWNYSHTPEWIPKFFSDLGMQQIICPGTVSWSKFAENIDASADNISTFAAYGKKYGALGILNTNWGDFGHPCSFNCNLFGMVFGAQKGWNVGVELDGDFKRTASLLLYGFGDVDMSESIYKIGQAELSADWFRFVMWHSANCLEGRKTELKYSDDGSLTAKDAKRHIEICDGEAKKLEAFSYNDAVYDVILAANAVSLMNRLYLFANKEEGYTDGAALQADFDEWLAKYEKAWLRDDKPSQLWRISEFVKNITHIPTGNREG